jgi:hypothetical protein
MKIPQKTKNGKKHKKMKLRCGLTISFLGISTKECNSVYTPMFIAVLFTIVKLWNQPTCPSPDEWITKMWCIYTIE